MPANLPSARVPDPSGLGRELTLRAMARALETVPKLEDHHMRRVALRRAGIVESSPADEHAAIAIVHAKRRAVGVSAGSLAA